MEVRNTLVLCLVSVVLLFFFKIYAVRSADFLVCIFRETV